MKKLFLLLCMAIFSFAIEQKFLTPEEAFQTSFEQKEDKLIFKLKLGKDIYLYDEKLKVLIIKPQKIDISKEVNLPKPVKYEEFIVHFELPNIEIPFSLLKSKVDATSYEVQVQFQGCSKAGLCYAPMKENKTVNLSEVKSKTSTTSSQASDINETDSIANTLKGGNIVLILATFFGFGLLLSLTPCVFPMIPILSSIIVSAGQNQKMTATKGFFLSLVYVLAMSVAYTFAGILAGLFGANLQVALQNPYVLSVFAAIFVALAFSMFGYFRIEPPQWLQTKVYQKTDGQEKNGVAGIALMGFLSALIVGPCVAPPLAGALVYIGQTGDAILGGTALFVMSLGMGIPLLAIGAGAGKFMPKPGGWMDSISRIFGILMLAIAIWMLDRVLPAIIVMYLWSFLFIGAAIYLKVYEHILVRVLTVVIFIYGTLTFVGAVSGATNVLNPLEKFTNKTVVGQVVSQELVWKKVKTNDELDAAIKASTKPVMLDFYADWCVSCKELEGITFKDEKVIKKLNEFTLLKADVTDNTEDDKALQKRFNVVGPPALIFWDSKNKEVKASQIVGYKNPEDFLNIVNKYFK